MDEWYTHNHVISLCLFFNCLHASMSARVCVQTQTRRSWKNDCNRWLCVKADEESWAQLFKHEHQPGRVLWNREINIWPKKNSETNVCIVIIITHQEMQLQFHGRSSKEFCRIFWFFLFFFGWVENKNIEGVSVGQWLCCINRMRQYFFFIIMK